MNRLLVAVLAAVDALIAATVGVAAALAPLTLFWVLGLGGGANWSALWPASVRLWQVGELVPVRITLPAEYVTATGIAPEASTFWLSLAPLAFAAFTAVFAARSGARAARAGAWVVGVASGSAVTAVVAVLLWRTSSNPVAAVYGWQAVLFPTLVFAVPALVGALVGAWRQGDDGWIDDLRARAERGAMRAVPDAAARGVGIAALGFVAVGALAVAVATILRGGEVIGLFEAAHVDGVGVVALALGALAYLPTLTIWGGAFVAGPGLAVGAGSTVSPAGTNTGVLPGIPALGIIPESSSQWMLLAVLAIVAVGFLAGWAARVRLVAEHGEGVAARLWTLAAIVVLGAGSAALLAFLASGGIGPGRMAAFGPAPGPVSFAVGVELLLGAGIALLSPVRARPRSEDTGVDAAAIAPARTDTEPLARSDVETELIAPSDAETQPLDPTPGFLADDPPPPGRRA